VKVADTVRSFKEIIAGKYDDIPEQAFYMKAHRRSAGRVREAEGKRIKAVDSEQ